MKVLVIGHTYIVPINRTKWIALANSFPDVNLKIIFPKKWKGHLSIHESQCEEKENLKNCSFHSLTTFFSGNETKYFYNPIQLSKIINSFKPDIIHVEQGDNALSYFEVILLSKFFCRNAKFCFFTWINWKHSFSIKYKLLWKWIEKINLKTSSGAFVGNADAKKILLQKKFIKPINVLPQLGIDLDIFKPQKNFNSKSFCIGFVGRFVKEKGLFTLVDTFSKICETEQECSLLLVGDGPERQQLEVYAKQLNIYDKIIFHSPVAHNQIPKIINQMDILVLPSYDTEKWREQFGHVLIEAMACKIPVIGSKAGEISNVIKNAGLIFEQKDSEDLARKIKFLIKNKNEYTALANKGFERAKTIYSNYAIAKKTYDFWKKII